MDDERQIYADTALEQTKAVLEGMRPLSFSNGVSKIMRIVLADCDTWVDSSGFFVLYPGTRRPFSYFPGLAPPAVASIVSACAIATPVRQPVRALLDPSSLPRRHLLAAWRPEILTVWLEPGEDAVRMWLRTGEVEELAELPPWTKPQPRYAHVPVDVDCPNCRRPQRQFRDHGDFLVCLACGRSLPRTAVPSEVPVWSSPLQASD